MNKPLIDNAGKPCCNNPDVRDGSIGFRFFKVKMCTSCGAAKFKNRFVEQIFAMFYCNLWNGKLFIDD